MRASSFSSAKVINLLNDYFVPVHLSNQDQDNGGAPGEEKAAKHRIYRDALAAGLKAGSVCTYMISPDGRPIAAAPLNESVAADPDRLAELMQRVVRELKVDKGDTLVQPKGQSAPRADADALVLHVVARYLQRQGDEYVPHQVKELLGTKKGVSWGSLPSEDWVVLSKAEWAKLLPPGEVRPETPWELPGDVAAKVLNHLYPPTENTDLKKNRIDEQVLQARVESIKQGVARVRIDGRLKMKHPFYHKDDNNFVRANLVGYLDFEVGKQRIRSLRLVTDNAQYGGNVNGVQPFGAAVRSVPPTK
jgi:hypothetical protein